MSEIYLSGGRSGPILGHDFLVQDDDDDDDDEGEKKKKRQENATQIRTFDVEDERQCIIPLSL